MEPQPVIIYQSPFEPMFLQWFSDHWLAIAIGGILFLATVFGVWYYRENMKG